MSSLTPYRNGRRLTTLGWDPMHLFEGLIPWQPPGSEVVWSAFSSRANVQHSDDGVTLTVDMPGVDPDDLNLTFEAGTLSIAGKRGQQTYHYSVALGNTIDPNQIEAQLDKGVL